MLDSCVSNIFFPETLNLFSPCVLQLDKGFVCGGFFTEVQKVFPLQLVTPSGDCVTPDFSNDKAQRNLHFLQNRRDALSAVPVDKKVYNLLNLEKSYTRSDAVSSEDIGTGIRIRSHQARLQSSEQGFLTQGIAPKRINLQKKLQLRSTCSLPKGFSYSEENSKVKPSVSEVRVISDEVCVPIFII